MRPSRYYQNCLHLVSGISDIFLVMFGFFVGRERLYLALLFAVLKYCISFVVRELMYKRMQAVVAEEGRDDVLQDQNL